MEITKGLLGKTYYNDPSFINVYLSTILAMYEFWEGFLFPNDPQRIVYSTNDYAFRRRLETNKREDKSNFQIQSLDMPFMNFSISSNGIVPNTDRTLKNNQLEVFGVTDWTIQKKIQLTPVQISFESTYFSNEEKDIQYVMSQNMWNFALETIIKPELEIEGETFLNYGAFGYPNLNYRPQYSERDWLEQNNIRTISMDFVLDTFLVQVNTSNTYWIPKTVLASFAEKHDLDNIDWDDYDSLITGVINHVTGETEIN